MHIHGIHGLAPRQLVLDDDERPHVAAGVDEPDRAVRGGVEARALEVRARVEAGVVDPALLAEVVTDRSAQLTAIYSNTGAIALFTSAIGPALGLKDAANILGAKGLSAAVAKELGIAELSQSAHELMAALAAWQLADSVRRASDETLAASIAEGTPSAARQEWMNAGSRLPSLSERIRLLTEQSPPDLAQSESQARRTALLLAAHRAASEAHQEALTAWLSLREWKDRVRQARGLARLCGTWQWTIHNPLGLGILDAFAAGLPLIVSDAAQRSPEVMAYLEPERNGMVAAACPQALAETVIALLADPARCERLALAARAAYAVYTLDAMVERFVAGAQNWRASPRR